MQPTVCANGQITPSSRILLRVPTEEIFGEIIDSKLTPLRNEVAHGILDSGELGMSTDDMLKLERVNLLLPLTRTIARWMLKNSFRDQFMVHMPDPPLDHPGELS